MINMENIHRLGNWENVMRDLLTKWFLLDIDGKKKEIKDAEYGTCMECMFIIALRSNHSYLLLNFFFPGDFKPLKLYKNIWGYQYQWVAFECMYILDRNSIIKTIMILYPKRTCKKKYVQYYWTYIGDSSKKKKSNT